SAWSPRRSERLPRTRPAHTRRRSEEGPPGTVLRCRCARCSWCSPAGEEMLRLRDRGGDGNPARIEDSHRVRRQPPRSRPGRQSRANAPAASASRSRYDSSLTSIPTPRMVPPLKAPGALYSWLTLSPLSRPMQRPSPESVNLPTCARIGPVATTLSSTYNLAVALESLVLPVRSL